MHIISIGDSISIGDNLHAKKIYFVKKSKKKKKGFKMLRAVMATQHAYC